MSAVIRIIAGAALIATGYFAPLGLAMWAGGAVVAALMGPGKQIVTSGFSRKLTMTSGN